MRTEARPEKKAYLRERDKLLQAAYDVRLLSTHAYPEARTPEASEARQMSVAFGT